MITQTSPNPTLTAIPGIRVGHATDRATATGCTVVLCPDGTVGGVDVRGGAPGTRETDLLHPSHLVDRVHAVVLSGGSAFGLATADGVMRWLAERETGWATPAGVVPIVPAAILYDLGIGTPAKPDAAMGYAACEASGDAPVEQGSVGAGTGCRVGGMMGNALATKGGIGSACIDLGDGLRVAALFAVNAAGDVIDEAGSILAGLRAPDGGFADTMTLMREMARAATPRTTRENTVIGVVATNARLSKEAVNKVAQMAHDGLARAVRPAHTLYDGDTIFALATGQIDADVSAIGAFAAEATTQAIRNGVRAATSLAGVRALGD
jgi:L-aminopeptidase/D-esterase-like protein